MTLFRWHPIDTAPKDGSEILGYWSRSRMYDVIEWLADMWQDGEGEVSAPTHWTPLPEPPDDVDGEELK